MLCFSATYMRVELVTRNVSYKHVCFTSELLLDEPFDLSESGTLVLRHYLFIFVFMANLTYAAV